jgi:sulfofructose kinase
MTVVCLGGVVLDRVFEIPQIPVEPVKVTATDYRETGGGVAATAAVAVANLGGEAAFWSRIGDDQAGDWLAADLTRRGVGIDGLQRVKGGRTGVAAVLVDPNGERMIAIAVFKGESYPRDLPLGKLKDGDVALVDARWPEGAGVLLEAARSRGMPRVLDADVGEDTALRYLAAGSDHAIFAAGALARLSGVSDPDAGLAWAKRHCPGLVAVTLGEGGVKWSGADGTGHQPAFAVTAKDTTGAGDVFHGAYALALNEGRPVVDAMRFAAAAAAIKCQRGAGWDGMPDRAQVDQLIKEGKTR